MARRRRRQGIGTKGQVCKRNLHESSRCRRCDLNECSDFRADMPKKHEFSPDLLDRLKNLLLRSCVSVFRCNSCQLLLLITVLPFFLGAALLPAEADSVHYPQISSNFLHSRSRSFSTVYKRNAVDYSRFSNSMFDSFESRLHHNKQSSSSISAERQNATKAPKIYFQRDSYVAHISEGKPAGTPVVTISIVEPVLFQQKLDEKLKTATKNSTTPKFSTSYSMSSTVDSRSDRFFHIDSSTGAVTTTNTAIDREQMNEHFFRVEAVVELHRSAIDSVRLTAATFLTIQIDDVNDNAPIFEQQQQNQNSAAIYRASGRENIPVGTVVASVKAIDRDDGRNAQIKYSIAQVEVFCTTGASKIAATTDAIYNVTESIAVNKPEVAKQNADNTREFHGKEEEADFSDYFVQGMNEFSTPSSTSHAVLITMSSDNSSNPFAVDEHNGIISTRLPLDREEYDKYKILVRAEDSAPFVERRSSTATVVITVEDENDNYPQFQAPTVYSPAKLLFSAYGTSNTSSSLNSGGGEQAQIVMQIDENVDVTGKPIVAHITAFDADDARPVQCGSSSAAGRDIRSGIYYSIIGGNLQSHFTIDSLTGDLRLVQPLDYEIVRSFRLVIRAQDSGMPPKSNTTIAVIRVHDVNDNAPKFQTQNFHESLSEDVLPGFSIVQIRAYDADGDERNSRLTYRIENASQDLPFKIDSETGWLSTHTALDRERASSYKFNVIASDAPSTHAQNSTHTALSATATVEINVVDVNDCAPQFQRPVYDAVISEVTQSGAHIITVKAVDEDESPRLTYSIVDGNRDGIFNIATQNGLGVMSLAKPVALLKQQQRRELQQNEQPQNRYVLIVRAADSDGKHSQCTVRVNVSDANTHRPVFERTPYRVHVVEDVPVGHVVVVVRAVDEDYGSNADLTYSILGKSLPDVNNRIDQEDERQKVAPFKLDAKSGAITTTRRLDRELVAAYTLTVMVEDGGRPQPLTDITDVEIIVDDVNDERPQFRSQQYQAVVREDVPIFTQIVQVEATDRDSGGQNGQVRYFIHHTLPTLTQSNTINILVSTSTTTTAATTVKKRVTRSAEKQQPTLLAQSTASNAQTATTFTPSAPAHAHFVIDSNTGIVRTNSTLDREQIQQYELTVIAVDGGAEHQHTSNTATTTVTVRIDDANDSPPVWPSDVLDIYVPESYQSGTPIVELLAVDADSGKNAEVSYEITGGRDAHMFSLVTRPALPAQLLANREFDYETLNGKDSAEKRPFFNVIVRASSPPLHSDVTLQIHIVDVNDNAPVLNNFYVILNTHNHRDFPFGIFGRVPAYDPDDSDTLHYEFLSGNKYNLLHMNSSTGELQLSASLRSNVHYHADMLIGVSDGQHFVSAKCTLITVLVDDAMIRDSLTLTLRGTTQADFLRPNRFEQFLQALAFAFGTTKENVFIFSVVESPVPESGNEEIKRDEDFVLFDNSNGEDEEENLSTQRDAPAAAQQQTRSSAALLDVTIAVRRGGGGGGNGDGTSTAKEEQYYFSVEYLRQRVYLRRRQLNDILHGQFQVLPFRDDDLCVREPCPNFEKCQSMLKFGRAGDWYRADTFLFRPIYPVDTFSCTCPSGFSGRDAFYACDTEVNMCYTNPCANGGKCEQIEGGFACQCQAGFTGTTCDIAFYRPSTTPTRASSNSSSLVAAIQYSTRACSKASSTDELPATSLVNDEISTICKNPSRCIEYFPRPTTTENNSSSSKLRALSKAVQSQHVISCENCQKNVDRQKSSPPATHYSFYTDACELTTRTFKQPGSYIMLPTLEGRNRFAISLQFSTRLHNALLFYNGRYRSQHRNNNNNEQGNDDFVALEIIDGEVVFHYSLGGEVQFTTVRATATQSSGSPRGIVNDGNWHTILVEYENRTATLTLDSCATELSIQFGHQHTKSAQKNQVVLADYACAARSTLKLPDICTENGDVAGGSGGAQCSRLFDLNAPFQLGSMPNFLLQDDNVDDHRQRPNNYRRRQHRLPLRNRHFVGCMRNVHINYKLIDLNSFIAQNGTEEGCAFKSSYCSTSSAPCANGATCVDSWGTYKCLCRDGFAGRQCEQKVDDTFTLTGTSHLLYEPQHIVAAELASASSKKNNAASNKWRSISLEFRTRQTYGTLLHAKMPTAEYELIVEIVNGALRLSGTLDAAVQRAHEGSLKLADGEWHTLELRIADSSRRLSVLVDYGTVFERQVPLSSAWYGRTLSVRRLSVGGLDRNTEETSSNSANSGFRGCVRNIRVDNVLVGDKPALRRGVLEGCRPIDQCSVSSPCPTHAQCEPLWESFACTCERGYYGRECISACELQPCQNGGQCQLDADQREGYACLCEKTNFTGRHCEQRKVLFFDGQCPAGWWLDGAVASCQPCQCDVSRGFAQQCNANSGECLCQENFYKVFTATKNLLPQQQLQCLRCNCDANGSQQNTQCDAFTGQCSCKPHVIGRRCDKCINEFAELIPASELNLQSQLRTISGQNQTGTMISGCHVVYGACPRQVRRHVEWPRSPLGGRAERPCPFGAIGRAERVCDAVEKRWSEPNLNNCTNFEFMKLFMATKSNLAASGALTAINHLTAMRYVAELRSAFEAVRETTLLDTADDDEKVGKHKPIFTGDLNVAYQILRAVLQYENTLSGLNLTHRRERDFLPDLVSSLSQVFDMKYASMWKYLQHGSNQPIIGSLFAELQKYLQTLAMNYHDTYTEPFEVQMPRAVLGVRLLFDASPCRNVDATDDTRQERGFKAAGAAAATNFHQIYKNGSIATAAGTKDGNFTLSLCHAKLFFPPTYQLQFPQQFQQKPFVKNRSRRRALEPSTSAVNLLQHQRQALEMELDSMLPVVGYLELRDAGQLLVEVDEPFSAAKLFSTSGVPLTIDSKLFTMVIYQPYLENPTSSAAVLSQASSSLPAIIQLERKTSPANDDSAKPICARYENFIWTTENSDAINWNSTHVNCSCPLFSSTRGNAQSGMIYVASFALFATPRNAMLLHMLQLARDVPLAVQVLCFICFVSAVLLATLALVMLIAARIMYSDMASIHKNLIICVLVVDLLFFLGVEPGYLRSSSTSSAFVGFDVDASINAVSLGCKLIAMLLQLFLLARLAWCMLAAVHLYRMAACSARATSSMNDMSEMAYGQMKPYYFIGYALPAILVIVTVALRSDAYGMPAACFVRLDASSESSVCGVVWTMLAMCLAFVVLTLFVTGYTACLLSALRRRGLVGQKTNATAGGAKNHDDVERHAVFKQNMMVILIVLGFHVASTGFMCAWLWMSTAATRNSASTPQQLSSPASTIVIRTLLPVIVLLEALFLFLTFCIGNARVQRRCAILWAKLVGRQASQFEGRYSTSTAQQQQSSSGVADVVGLSRSFNNGLNLLAIQQQKGRRGSSSMIVNGSGKVTTNPFWSPFGMVTASKSADMFNTAPHQALPVIAVDEATCSQIEKDPHSINSEDFINANHRQRHTSEAAVIMQYEAQEVNLNIHNNSTLPKITYASYIRNDRHAVDGNHYATRSEIGLPATDYRRYQFSINNSLPRSTITVLPTTNMDNNNVSTIGRRRHSQQQPQYYVGNARQSASPAHTIGSARVAVQSRLSTTSSTATNRQRPPLSNVIKLIHENQNAMMRADGAALKPWTAAASSVVLSSIDGRDELRNSSQQFYAQEEVDGQNADDEDDDFLGIPLPPLDMLQNNDGSSQQQQQEAWMAAMAAEAECDRLFDPIIGTSSITADDAHNFPMNNVRRLAYDISPTDETMPPPPPPTHYRRNHHNRLAAVEDSLVELADSSEKLFWAYDFSFDEGGGSSSVAAAHAAAVIAAHNAAASSSSPASSVMLHRRNPAATMCVMQQSDSMDQLPTPPPVPVKRSSMLTAQVRRSSAAAATVHTRHYDSTTTTGGETTSDTSKMQATHNYYYSPHHHHVKSDSVVTTSVTSDDDEYRTSTASDAAKSAARPRTQQRQQLPSVGCYTNPLLLQQNFGSGSGGNNSAEACSSRSTSSSGTASGGGVGITLPNGVQMIVNDDHRGVEEESASPEYQVQQPTVLKMVAKFNAQTSATRVKVGNERRSQEIVDGEELRDETEV